MKYISPYLPKFDQEGFGSCVSISFSTMMEIFQMDKMKTIDVPELSRMYLHAECKARDGVTTSQGTYASTACSVLKNKGICEESLLPYIVTDDVRKLKFPNRTQEMHDNARNYRIKSYATTKSVEKIKEHILKYGACVMEENFHHMKFNKNVLVEIGRKSKNMHETCLIGFDDEFEYMGFKGAFVRINGDNSQLQYGYGIEIIPYSFFSHSWFVKATLCTPTNPTRWLRENYTGKEIIVPTDKVELTIGSNKAYINGIEKEVSPAPFIKNKTTLVPLRFVSQAFRKVDVNWIGETKTITVSDYTGDYYFKIGRKEVLNGYGEVVYRCGIPPEIINGTTMIPIRAFSEVLGANVLYDGKTKAITIIK